MSKIELSNLTLTLNPDIVNRNFMIQELKKPFSIENLNLIFEDGKTTAILGPSGCGKSTLLRLTAGLMKPESGRIFYDDIDVTETEPSERGIGMVFQDYALYPNRDSRTNVSSFFFFRKKTPEMENSEKEKFLITSRIMGVEFDHLLGKMPKNMSGGEKQKIAVARCITRNPKLFLLDEPFSNLDAAKRDEYRVKMKKLLLDFKITTVFVTHDQREAFSLGDYIAVMNEGKIIQYGTSENIFSDPDDIFVMEFVNPEALHRPVNFFDGGILSEKYVDYTAAVKCGDIHEADETQKEFFDVTVSEIRSNPLRQKFTITVFFSGKEIVFDQMDEPNFHIGDLIHVSFENIYFFDKKTGKRVRNISQ